MQEAIDEALIRKMVWSTQTELTNVGENRTFFFPKDLFLLEIQT